MSKSKYESHVEPKLTLIEAWARDGLTLQQIAHNLGIADSTLRAYRDKNDALAAALARGAEVVDVEVENALLKKAIGYDKTETTKELRKDPETGELRLVVTKIVTRHYPGDVTAQMFWLANRKRSVWSYKPQPDQEEQDGETGVVELPAAAEEPQPPSNILGLDGAENPADGDQRDERGMVDGR